MMIKYENDCVGCPPEIGCLGSSCPNRNVPHTYCDRCSDEAQLYQFGGEQICEDCLDMEVQSWWNSLDIEERREIYCEQSGDLQEVEV